jgi:hypothetical protein|tara:strand:- start:176 stop:346 length:171 start_codon:yes stop_codon:yes gene_type:complete
VDYKDKIILEMSTSLASLSIKVAALQAKINEMCKSTGDCARVKEVNRALNPEKTEK